MAANTVTETSRRLTRRKTGRRSTEVSCFANAMGLGPNIGYSLHDVSEQGARLSVKMRLLVGQEISLSLCGLGHRRAVSLPARVIWCAPAVSGMFQIGVRFHKQLAYLDLQLIGQ